ncbi:hypothetical protein NC653_003802 [Populus alba x Populus x berolinensis]|uniref:DUF4283 domain-containing protein n=1 Tax=Populus alba x Populus x berolinensis TaxID=444605 RepID=A0AAD6WIL7_9ROSI|nr:hypothetical protein NC653_003802 [Populus alba x Populus x berolinensis]
MNMVSADTLAGVRSLPTKPPDIVNEFGFSSGQERVSFRDKILGIQTPSSMRERKLNGGFELIDIGNGFFMVKFDLADDRAKIINVGPWMPFDHYFAVHNWSSKLYFPQKKSIE